MRRNTNTGRKFVLTHIANNGISAPSVFLVIKIIISFAITIIIIDYNIALEQIADTVYPTKYAHGFVVLCFVVVMQLFIMNSHEVFIHIHQGCFAGTGAIVRLPQCQ